MAKVSFSKSNEGQSVEETEAVAAVAAKPEVVEAKAEVVVEAKAEVVDSDVPAKVSDSTEVATREEGDTGFSEDDDIGLEEVILPRINLVQKVGPLSEEFTPGEVVLNKELVIYTIAKKEQKVAPLEITILGFRPTLWTERVEGGALGNVFKTPREVAESGGTTIYKVAEDSRKEAKLNPEVKEIPYYQQLATALVVIKRPEGIDEDGIYFNYPHDGNQYAIAQWSMKGGAFTNGAKIIKTAKKIGHLRVGGYCSFSYNMHTFMKKYSETRFGAIPILRPGVKHTPEFQAFAQEILGGEV